jgi:predicted metal-dependent peptidase
MSEKIETDSEVVETKPETDITSPVASKSKFRYGDFDQVFANLWQQEPFLALISMEITKIIDTKCKTAYIGLRRSAILRNKYDIVLGFNPEFITSLPDNQKIGVMIHEFYHFIFHHILSRSSSVKEDQKLFNWAADMAINSLICDNNHVERLPDFALLPGRHPKDPETGEPLPGKYAEFMAKAPLKQSTDYYFDELKRIRDEEQEKNGGKGASMDVILGNPGTLDDHDGWGEIPEEIAEQLRNRIGEIIDKSAKQAQRTNRWGSVPQEAMDWINKLLSREVDWRSILRNFIGRARSVERNSTIKRINKKMPYIHPGVRRPLIANFVCFMDQSGSMLDEDIATLFGELQNLADLVTLDVYHFDTEIDEKSHMKWRKGDANPKLLRTRRGGTDFNAVANFVNRPENRGKWSGCLILSDGYAPTMGLVNGPKVLWVITEHGTMDAVRVGDLAVQMKKSDGKFQPY